MEEFGWDRASFWCVSHLRAMMERLYSVLKSSVLHKRRPITSKGMISGGNSGIELESSV